MRSRLAAGRRVESLQLYMGKLAKAARREEWDGKGWRGRFGRLLDRPAIFPIRASSMPSRAGVDHPPPPRLWRTSSSFGSAICQSDGQIGAHAPELIIFPRGGKTDWGKKRGIFGDLFWPGNGRKRAQRSQRNDRDGQGPMTWAGFQLRCQ